MTLEEENFFTDETKSTDHKRKKCQTDFKYFKNIAHQKTWLKNENVSYSLGENIHSTYIRQQTYMKKDYARLFK